MESLEHTARPANVLIVRSTRIQRIAAAGENGATAVYTPMFHSNRSGLTVDTLHEQLRT